MLRYLTFTMLLHLTGPAAEKQATKRKRNQIELLMK